MSMMLGVCAAERGGGLSSWKRFIRIPWSLSASNLNVIPKKSLTGDSTERVDTRVLQVIYRVEDQNASLYVGQQMDVYIKTPDVVNPVAPRPESTVGHGQ